MYNKKRKIFLKKYMKQVDLMLVFQVQKIYIEKQRKYIH